MILFEIGKTYFAHSACDYDCIFAYKVLARTASTITIQDTTTKEVRRRKISKWSNAAEEVLPKGYYSMCPILSADRHF